MLRIGLTGGIGSGKTTVAKIFEVLGIPVYYADDAAKRIMNEDEQLKKAIIRTFGADTFKNNQLDRQALAAIVFNDPQKLTLLNTLVHPATIADADQWMQMQTSPYVLKEAALIFETDAWKHLDLVIGVRAPLELRLQHTMKRDNIDREAVEARINKQMNEAEKMNRCDFIIENNNQELLIPQVVSLHEKLLNAAVQAQDAFEV